MANTAKVSSTRQQGSDSFTRVSWLILVCFFLSGFTGLVYEILWTRLLVKLIGGAPFAVSIILTVFMGGLGLGAYLASRIIDRAKGPGQLIRLYGILELVVAGYCLVLPGLLVLFRPLFAVLYNQLFDHFMLYSVLNFIGCCALLAVPVMCMGATLPILCRFYVTSLTHTSSHTGRLYGLNTIGAALGALACGFWMIDRMGAQGTLIAAVTLNAVIGGVCILVSVRVKFPDREPEPGQDPALLNDPSRETPKRSTLTGALIIFAVSGFCSMAYEVIWTKLLGVIVGPTSYSFTVVLVTFITGLALGSMLFGRLGDKTRDPIALLCYTQVGAALSALVVSHLLGNSQLFFAKLLFHTQDSFGEMNLVKAGVLFGFMLIPTLCLGATFPLVSKIYTRSVAHVGRSIGIAYAINTMGAVLGSFCAGFVLIPLLGKETGLRLITVIQLVTCLVVAGMTLANRFRDMKRWVPIAGPVCLGVVLSLYYPSWDRHLLSMGRYQRFDDISLNLGELGWGSALFNGPELLRKGDESELIYYGDGIGGFTTVMSFPRPGAAPHYVIVNGGKVDGSSGEDMMTQTLLAHLPMLFHANPKHVMVLGLATGVTAGEVLHYPIERLDVLEISKQVVEASDIFTPWNNQVLAHPKTHIIVQDGRAHLQLTHRRYDVIISEPSNPWMAGVATLFTREFFELAKDKLNDNGIFVQWFHTYQVNWETFSLVGRTFRDVFPNGLLALTSPSGQGSDFLFVGFKGKQRLNLENARRQLKYIQKSENVKLLYPELFYRLLVSEDLGRLFAAGPINTDNHPLLEFSAPRLLYTFEGSAIRLTIDRHAVFSEETTAIRDHLMSDVDAQIDFAAYALSVNAPFKDMVPLSKVTPAQKQRFFQLVDEYARDNPVEQQGITDNRELLNRCFQTRIMSIQSKIDASQDPAYSYFYLGQLCVLVNRNEEAVGHFRKAIDIKPDWAAPLNSLAWRLAVHSNAPYYDPGEAVTLALKACQLSNRQEPNLLDTLAAAYAANGQFDRAVAVVKEGLELAESLDMPDIAEQLTQRLNLFLSKQAYAE
ncbi:MAG: fused MFS/spermidine synthase [Phycisphaerae bacterium]|nr:fused MFS/spermidine synthase [Phycisphaerae bacterium]